MSGSSRRDGVHAACYDIARVTEGNDLDALLRRPIVGAATARGSLIEPTTEPSMQHSMTQQRFCYDRATPARGGRITARATRPDPQTRGADRSMRANAPLAEDMCLHRQRQWVHRASFRA